MARVNSIPVARPRLSSPKESILPSFIPDPDALLLILFDGSPTHHQQLTFKAALSLSLTRSLSLAHLPVVYLAVLA